MNQKIALTKLLVYRFKERKSIMIKKKGCDEKKTN